MIPYCSLVTFQSFTLHLYCDCVAQVSRAGFLAGLATAAVVVGISVAPVDASINSQANTRTHTFTHPHIHTRTRTKIFRQISDAARSSAAFNSLPQTLHAKLHAS